MNKLIRTRYDKFLLALAMVVVTLSGGWMWRQQSEVGRLQGLPVTVQLTGSVYEPVSGRQPETKMAGWTAPVNQSNGNGWLYEVFTPPVIYYNTLAGSFTVTPPHELVESGTPIGLELIEVKLEPFRLQLVGYFGGPGDYLAAFVSPSSPGTLLVREGHRFEKLGLIFKSFVVKKVAVDNIDSRPVFEAAALAVLEDEKTGTAVVLDSRVRKFTDRRAALFHLLAEDVQTSELHEGETFSAEGSTYCIERIQLDPPEVVLARQTAGLPEPETRILHPIAGIDGPDAGKSAKSNPFPSRSFTELATNEK